MSTDHKPTSEELARPKMEEILFNNGLQVTLKVLIDSLQKMIDERGGSAISFLILESLRGIHKGYLRRYDSDKE